MFSISTESNSSESVIPIYSFDSTSHGGGNSSIDEWSSMFNSGEVISPSVLISLLIFFLSLAYFIISYIPNIPKSKIKNTKTATFLVVLIMASSAKYANSLSNGMGIADIISEGK